MLFSLPENSKPFSLFLAVSPLLTQMMVDNRIQILLQAKMVDTSGYCQALLCLVLLFIHCDLILPLKIHTEVKPSRVAVLFEDRRSELEQLSS